MKLRGDSGGMRSTYAREQPFLAGETVTGGSFECERCDFRLDKETGKVTNLPVCPRCQGDRWRPA
jgi:hypothetical protein